MYSRPDFWFQAIFLSVLSSKWYEHLGEFLYMAHAAGCFAGKPYESVLVVFLIYFFNSDWMPLNHQPSQLLLTLGLQGNCWLSYPTSEIINGMFLRTRWIQTIRGKIMSDTHAAIRASLSLHLIYAWGEYPGQFFTFRTHLNYFLIIAIIFYPDAGIIWRYATIDFLYCCIVWITAFSFPTIV